MYLGSSSGHLWKSKQYHKEECWNWVLDRLISHHLYGSFFPFSVDTVPSL